MSEQAQVGGQTQAGEQARSRRRASQSRERPSWYGRTGELARGTFAAARFAGHSGSLSYRLRATRRGVFTIGPFSVREVDPFGFVQRWQTFPVHTELVVTPTPTSSIVSAGDAGSREDSALTRSTDAGEGVDNVIARPYIPGDSMRRIHWRASTHRDTLMVRQEEQNTTENATVVLDRSGTRWAPEAALRTGVDAGFESAVSACLSAVMQLVSDGYNVVVVDSDGEVLTERIEARDLEQVRGAAVEFASILARSGDRLHELNRQASLGVGPLLLIVGKFDIADAEALRPLAHRSAQPTLLATAATADALNLASQVGWSARALMPTSPSHPGTASSTGAAKPSRIPPASRTSPTSPAPPVPRTPPGPSMPPVPPTLENSDPQQSHSGPGTPGTATPTSTHRDTPHVW